MALNSQEAIFAKQMILHRNKVRAVRAAFPHLKKEYTDIAIKYMMQNPEVQRHIDAGILYIYRDIVKDRIIAEPQPLTIDEQIALLKMIIFGKRLSPRFIASKTDGLQTVFVPPTKEELADAKWMLAEINRSRDNDWMI